MTVEERGGTEKHTQCVLKIYENQQDLQDEFENLTELTRCFGEANQDFGVPTPFAILPEVRGLLMSRVPGKRLDSIIWATSLFNRNGEQDLTRASDGIRKAAAWLAQFQNLTSRHEAHAMMGEELLKQVNTSLVQCSERSVCRQR